MGLRSINLCQAARPAPLLPRLCVARCLWWVLTKTVLDLLHPPRCLSAEPAAETADRVAGGQADGQEVPWPGARTGRAALHQRPSAHGGSKNASRCALAWVVTACAGKRPSLLGTFTPLAARGSPAAPAFLSPHHSRVRPGLPAEAGSQPSIASQHERRWSSSIG